MTNNHEDNSTEVNDIFDSAGTEDLEHFDHDVSERSQQSEFVAESPLKKLFFPIVIGVVLIVGVFIAFQLLGNKTADQQQANVVVPLPKPIDLPAENHTASNNDTMPQPFNTPISTPPSSNSNNDLPSHELVQQPETIPQSPLPPSEPTPPSASNSTSAPTTAAEIPAVPQAPAAPDVPNNNPTPQQQAAAAPITEHKGIEQAPLLPPAALPSTHEEATSHQTESYSNLSTGKVAELENKLADLSKSLEALDRKISALSAGSRVTQSSTSSAELIALSNRLDKLERRAGKTGTATPVTAPATATEEVIEQPVAATPKPAVKKITPRHTTTTHHKQASHSAKPVASSSAWSLRGAGEGFAIIGKSDGHVEQVRKGDVVPGLGKILAISQQNGKWVVKGTNQTISR